ncbi:hypothetical protein RFI_18037 [Reticulomyxa filosa]|uniref:Uncharacterized protein n=1 Tax=Reticulomyxa filosa TaxID=46433 RepID=X6N0C7_RETFI|nr:hypothetical protein RFI_18037 [Reticulomyxa filosa]|eukprot:ETO19194.1 hypothetical protein RFI_18037 [Reticulomyxa filosa]
MLPRTVVAQRRRENFVSFPKKVQYRSIIRKKKASMRAERIFYIGCCAPLLSGIGYVAFVKLRLRNSQHRPVSPVDNYYIKNMKGQSPLLGENPGIRIEENFLSPNEQKQLRLDAHVLLNQYGYSSIPFYMKDTFLKQLGMYQSRPTLKVNAFKCSGRPPADELQESNWTPAIQQAKKEHDAHEKPQYAYESNPPVAAPWGCGNGLNVRQLPSSFQTLISKIKSQSTYSLGAVRDVTIDFRDHKYFRLFPHKYPMEDGSNLFMLTLDSDVVLTLLPSEKDRHRRTEIFDQSLYSFTDADIDVLHRKGDLLCLSDKARLHMELAVRQGVEEPLSTLKFIRNRMTRDNEELSNSDEETTASENSGNFEGSNKRIVGNLETVDKSTVLNNICFVIGGASKKIFCLETKKEFKYISLSADQLDLLCFTNPFFLFGWCCGLHFGAHATVFLIHIITVLI